MSIHKLTAGSGYDYLTRQVAALDATDRGHTSLASYYSEKGEVPGRWVGSGLAGIHGLSAGDTVTAEQMLALFGSGHHPLARELQDRLEGPDLTAADYAAVTRLGAPFKVYAGDASAFRVEVAARVAAATDPDTGCLPPAARALIRTQVATEFYRAEHGRDPADARELAGYIAKASRPRTAAVAGFDLTFRPVKSVSALWAIADPSTAAAVERAHEVAVADALAFVESHALYTRLGTNGVRQVDVRGLVAAAFTHRDSRAGDPLLHTHVAVANKVQTLDGRWLAIDGRILFKATVAASETYNTALERHLHDTLGVRFEPRPDTDPRKAPVREVVGIDPALNARWSARRAAIDTRHAQLAAAFQADHGRPPTPVEALHLAQQATLETRAPKHEPRNLTEQRATWRAQAIAVLGSASAVEAMLARTLTPAPAPAEACSVVDAGWLAATAALIVTELEGRRSTWQTWHVRAAAHRHVRATTTPTSEVEALVDRLVHDVLATGSVSLARPTDAVVEPPVLRRRDGHSVYTVAGATLYTSARVVAAEQRLLAAAGRTGGYIVPSDTVEVALLEGAANGVTLNPGQAHLVRAMATSGARLQVAIAPAGTGKTTALAALARAWTHTGGTVLGLAPSAAAADSLRAQIHAPTDTLAKLAWTLNHPDQPAPEWVTAIGPATLVIIDEAGMADTLTLDDAVEHALARGASVRLVGDDQQLAAIGAGGVLRDIAATHGALHLRDLLRFTNPAEAAATLALRDGLPEALGFYLDHHRVHVGDLATLTDAVFTAWRTDRTAGLDSIMLAPTRDLTRELNDRARAHRLAGTDPGPAVALADGCHAGVGDLIITRANNRRLRVTAADWVKNGDRWTVTALTPDGGLTVRHTRHGHTAHLPAGYVTTAVDLGYAATIHTAQGLTVDTMHGLASSDLTRQQLYTMLTRGRHTNHLYLPVVGDGDPHTLPRPETVRPVTPTDLLETILATDHTPASATTHQRDLADPAGRLGEAAARYTDALHVAAEQTLGQPAIHRLEKTADRLAHGLTTAPAWPALRAHLVLLAATGTDPGQALRDAVLVRELDTAADPAAVLDWRLDDTPLTAGAPLPWLPGIPTRLARHPQWGPYLAARHTLVTGLAATVHAAATNETAAGGVPGWARDRGLRLDSGLAADLAVWRAATGVDPADRRPTGPPQLAKTPTLWQCDLTRRLAAGRAPALTEWAPLLHQLAPDTAGDDYLPVLADRLAAMSRAGLEVPGLLRAAAALRPLPDEHAAAALWWRLAAHLSPAVTLDSGPDLDADAWTPRLRDLLGPDGADTVHASPWWPTLAAGISHALAAGWRLDDLITTTPSDCKEAGAEAGIDEALALTWRISVLTDPAPLRPDDHPASEPNPAPADLHHGAPLPGPGALEPATGHPDLPPDPEPFDPDLPLGDPPAPTHRTNDEPADVVADIDTASVITGADPDDVTAVLSEPGLDGGEAGAPCLAFEALVRDHQGPLEPSDMEIRDMEGRAAAWLHAPVARERMLHINTLAVEFFEAAYPGSWSQTYLTHRFRRDVADHPAYRPGHAPAGWTTLTQHLHRAGVTDQELLAAGLATTTSSGRVIDRFRDRVILPVTDPDGAVLGFVARRHPDLTDADPHAGPKYVNTPTTALYHKGKHLYGDHRALHAPGAVPVLVEGPMDAIAVTLTGHGAYVGVSPLGTALTVQQARRLAGLGVDPIVATDADPAGRLAAERDYWLLTPHRLDPRSAQLPPGTDPAQLLATGRPDMLYAALQYAQPLSQLLLDERLTTLPAKEALPAAALITAARPPHAWGEGIHQIATRLHIPADHVADAVAAAVAAWNTDPRAQADRPLRELATRSQPTTGTIRRPIDPMHRWAALATALDPRLATEPDWGATADLIQHAHNTGHDIPTTLHRILAGRPLGPRPAQDLRYRLVADLQLTIANAEPLTSPPHDWPHPSRPTDPPRRPQPQHPHAARSR